MERAAPRSLEVPRKQLVPGPFPEELSVLEQLPRPLVAEILAVAREDHHALEAQRAARQLDLLRILAPHRGLLGMPVLGLVRDLLGVSLLAPRVAMRAVVGRKDRGLAGPGIAVDR